MTKRVFVLILSDTGSSNPGKCKRRDCAFKEPGTSKRQETTSGQLFVFC